MESPLALISRINLTSSRVRVDAEYADSLRDFLYKKKLSVSAIESRPQPVVRIVKTESGSPDVNMEEYGAAFHVTAPTETLKELLVEWVKTLEAKKAAA